ncbi:MAG: hypothetical protein RBU29_05610, partial [bacterium]|nr:hypothetical protein [bacterium]
SEADLKDLSVFDLRKMLHASVTVVKETNLETVYSNLISASADFDTAAGAKMVANTWVGLFLARAEEIVKENVVRQIQFTKDRATALEAQLAKTEQALTESQNSAHLEQRRSELASNLVSLTGVAPTYQKQNRTDEAFNLEDENAPFMKEKREALDTLSFSVAPTYSQALLPQLSELERAALVSKQLAETVADPEQRGRLHERQQEQESQLAALRQRIASVQDEIRTDSAFIRTKETEIAGLERQRQQVLSSLQAIQPLLDEAMLLESSHGDTRYADVSAGWAIKPDKRSFPKRSLMTLAGLAVSFVLFCGLAFFVDIWDEVVKPEAETEEANVS